jgi:hypothetical protein
MQISKFKIFDSINDYAIDLEFLKFSFTNLRHNIIASVKKVKCTDQIGKAVINQLK